MKKNKFLKVAGAIFTMCLMTTCAIGTTFAKYTTQSSASDTARVAKWGVQISASGTMFGTAYQDTILENGDKNATVQSYYSTDVTADKVVAPGTMNNTGIEISIKGKPEVEYKIEAKQKNEPTDIYLVEGNYGVMIKALGINAATDFEEEELYTLAGGTYTRATVYDADDVDNYYRLTDKAEVADETYYPIVWSASVAVNGTTYKDTFDTMVEAFEALIDGINDYDGTNTADYAQFDPNTEIDLVYKLTWAWAFDKQNDGADTILGNLMAGDVTVVKLATDGTYSAVVSKDDYNLTVGSGFTVTATQVD